MRQPGAGLGSPCTGCNGNGESGISGVEAAAAIVDELGISRRTKWA